MKETQDTKPKLIKKLPNIPKKPQKGPKFNIFWVYAAIILGIIGTAIATIMFYMLVKRAGGIFATTVTYGIPFVAIGWGIFYKESFGWLQIFCLVIILIGVYYTNQNTKKELLKFYKKKRGRLINK